MPSGSQGLVATRTGQENIIFMERQSPSLQKQEHAWTAAFYRSHFRKIKHNDSRVS
jgi:hypothetical protein